MRKSVLLLTAATLLLAGCAKQDDFGELEQRVFALSWSNITTIDGQISNIGTSIDDLENAKKVIDAKIITLQQRTTAASDSLDLLTAESGRLAETIASLRTHVQALSSGNRTWTEATFGTIAQITGVQKRLDALEELAPELQASIGKAENDLKKWVGVELEAYATIAGMEEAIEAAEGRLDGSLVFAKDSLGGEITQLKNDLKTLKTTLTSAYQEAIRQAIETNAGNVNQETEKKISDATTALNNALQPLQSKIPTLENRMTALENAVAAFVGRVQSVTVMPARTDGTVPVLCEGASAILFEIKPADAAKALVESEDAVSFFRFRARVVQTKAEALTSGFVDFDVTSVEMDKDGFVEVTVEPKTALDTSLSYAARLMVEANNGTGSYICKTSSYFPLELLTGVPGGRRIAVTGERTGLTITE